MVGRIHPKDGLALHGRVDLMVTQGRPLIIPGKVIGESGGVKIYDKYLVHPGDSKELHREVVHNIIVNTGKDKVITALVLGNIHQLGRMAIGDRGAFPSDLTQPKTPTEDMTTLFNEVYRADADAITRDVGTPNVHEVQLVKTFEAIDVPITAFSNQATPIINEVGLITFDATEPAGPLPRPPVAAPSAPPADERLFSIRTFKSVPFEVANEISVTIRYTIFIA